MTVFRKFTPAETWWTDRIHDVMVLPISRKFTLALEDAETIEGLCRDRMLRRVTTVFGAAVTFDRAHDHGPWDPCAVTGRANLDHAAALTALRIQLERQDFTLHRYGWRTRPLSTDPTDRPGIPEVLYMDAPAALLSAQASKSLRQSLPDALACLCLVAPPDLSPADVRRAYQEHQARHPHSPGPVIVGAPNPDGFRKLAQELCAQHWTRYAPGILSGLLPVPLPPLLAVSVDPKVK